MYMNIESELYSKNQTLHTTFIQNGYRNRKVQMNISILKKKVV